ncbi:MAG: 30S ribosomal protein S3 [Candidatus Sungbacteria bacterium]|uniref:Small ribosomal subunit protein uS3 n=1 Tax=Candidatus Sungiibacteriota bacterium TaxID=2750080 RepID=A0A931WP57_9BACT|nr:30S ribosomal protein S3 [Candidatus Sungbacteria bacterium]
MTHRVHPYVFRLGINTTWKSRWFNAKKYREYLREDTLVREWLTKKLRQAHIDAIDIERSPTAMNVIIRTARPGILIGRGGEGAEKLKQEIQKKLRQWALKNAKAEKRDLKLTIEDVKSPETRAAIVAQMVADELEKRIPFRRVLKQTIEKVMQAKGVEGIKIAIAGRLDGAEMARYEWLKRGRIPLQTLRASIDYAHKEAYTTYGVIGIKVWVYKGEVFEGQPTDPDR